MVGDFLLLLLWLFTFCWFARSDRSYRKVVEEAAKENLLVTKKLDDLIKGIERGDL